jgi:hypothetical protein
MGKFFDFQREFVSDDKLSSVVLALSQGQSVGPWLQLGFCLVNTTTN